MSRGTCRFHTNSDFSQLAVGFLEMDELEEEFADRQGQMCSYYGTIPVIPGAYPESDQMPTGTPEDPTYK